MGDAFPHGRRDGTIVQLVPMSHDNESPIAEATVNGGKFTFKGEIGDSLPLPICVNLKVKDSYGVETFMLEKGDITIEGKATKGEPDQNGVINYTWDVTVKGSPLTDKFNVYKKGRKVVNPQTGMEIELPGTLIGVVTVQTMIGDTPETEISFCSYSGQDLDENHLDNYYILDE